MNALYLLLGASLLLALVFVAGFIWASRSGQYDDMQTPSLRVLGDDEPRPAGGKTRGEHDNE